ncbi:hypothetical protein HK104_010677 [Borealophlyctis nickersoniae]|nr:hypothetical protein HK104_010677 [Borealophlyctis nickersoniae]
MAITVPVMLAAGYVGHRYSPSFRNLYPPIKLSLGLAIPTAVFFTVTDKAAIEADRELVARFSVTRPEDAAAIARERQPVWTMEGFKKYAYDNRLKLLGYSWAAAVAGVLMYTYNRKDITKSQKIINARLVSQVLALVGAGAFALSLGEEKEKPIPVDAHFERVMRGEEVMHHQH